jgi:hypothetical protein
MMLRNKDSSQNGFIVFCIASILLLFFITPASAGAPPPDCRPGYLLPYLHAPYINPSNGDCFYATDTYPTNLSFRSPPFFLNMSENHAFMNITCNKTGDRYVSEVWYFTDWNEFRAQREALFSYLTQHGTLSNVSLDLSEELARVNNTYISGLKTRQIDAIKYENSATSGYFVIFSTSFFPGPNYYITYYGVVESTDLQQHTPQLETLIMTTFPRFMEHQTNVYNPEFPMASQSTPFPAGIILIAIGITAFIRAQQGR